MKKTVLNKGEVKISSLPPGRWEDFKSLRLRSLKEEQMAFLSSYDDEANLGKDEWERRIKNVVFAIVDGKPIGMMTFVLRGRAKNDHIADIFGVYVEKKFRGKGIGNRLLRNVISRIRKNDRISKISLSVVADQTPAVSLYMKYGFKVVGILERELKLNGNYYDELVMEKILR